MKKEAADTLKAFVVELAVYGVLVVIYFLAVLRFLQGHLQHLMATHIRIYGLVAILLILGQAVALESLTTALMRLLRGRSE